MSQGLRLAQTNFSAGEFSPLMAARSDVSLYKNGAAALSNFRLRYQGGATVRFGLRYLATLGYSPVKLVPFVFNLTQAYVFVFSNGRVDIYDTSGNLVASLTNAPWTTAMLPRLNWAQRGDTMIVVHPSMATQVIRRTGASTFTLSAYVFDTDATVANRLLQPYFKFADPAMTLTPSATTGSITLTLSGAGIWSAAYLNVYVRYKKKQIKITAVTSATVATGTVIETLPDTTGGTDWDEAVFNPARGYANSVIWFGDRLWFGGSQSAPISIWASQVGAYFNFDLGTGLAAQAIWENAPSTHLSEIRHLLDFRHLIIFGDRSFLFIPTSPETPIQPSTMQIVPMQPYGISYVRPQVIDDAPVYVQSNGLVVREAYFDFLRNIYTADSITGLAAHLPSMPTEVAAVYGGNSVQNETYLMLVNGDGRLLVYHSVRAEKMSAWVPWTTSGTFQAICATPGQIFVAVQRTLAGGSSWTLEVFDETIAPLDCSIKATNGSPTNSFPGFGIFNGMAVDVVSNGHYLGQYTPQAGTITIAGPAVSQLEAGLGFQPKITPMPADFDLQDGPARGLFKRLIRSLLTVDSLTGLQIQGRDWLPPFTGDDFADPPTSTTGVIEMRVNGVGREGQFDITVPTGRKGSILAFARELWVGK